MKSRMLKNVDRMLRSLPFPALLLCAAYAGGAPDCARLVLQDVAADAGIDFRHQRGASDRKHLPETMGSGLAWLDFDQDGLLDLYVVQSGPFPPDGSDAASNRLFRNLGDGTFEDVTSQSGAAGRGYGQGVVAVDVNGDGATDLYVANYGADALYLNTGNGRFRDATKEAGLGLGGWSSSAALADADGDGDLDLYVARYLDYDPEDDIFCGDPAALLRDYCHPRLFAGASDKFYLNDGKGSFTDATESAGLSEATGKGLGVIFSDLNQDGRADIYVANDTTMNFLYRNDGGTFEDLSLVSGTGFNADAQTEAGMGIALGDVDGDGDPDLAVTNFDAETNTLYRNSGNLLFEDISARSGFGVPSFNLLGFGIAMVDLNRDGNLDLYVANGHILERPARQGVSYRERDLLFLGNGEGRFEPSLCGPALETATVSRGLAAADYDNDGDIDLAILNSGGHLSLLRNGVDGNGGPWVGIQLRGRAPNTEAVGARITLVSRVRRTRWVLAGDSYQSSSDRRVLFGFPEDDPPKIIDVLWPSAERTTVPIEATDYRRYLTIEEVFAH